MVGMKAAGGAESDDPDESSSHAEDHAGDDFVWQRRADARLRQIRIGKARPEYKRYVTEVSPARRSSSMPRTPDHCAKVSKRTFDRELGAWRRKLHEVIKGWDEKNALSEADTSAALPASELPQPARGEVSAPARNVIEDRSGPGSGSSTRRQVSLLESLPGSDGTGPVACGTSCGQQAWPVAVQGDVAWAPCPGGDRHLEIWSGRAWPWWPQAVSDVQGSWEHQVLSSMLAEQAWHDGPGGTADIGIAANPAAPDLIGRAVVWISGLLATDTEADVLAMFSFHDMCDKIFEGQKPVLMIKELNSAIVKMCSQQDAELAMRRLNGQTMNAKHVTVRIVFL